MMLYADFMQILTVNLRHQVLRCYGRIGWSMMYPILFMDQEEWYREGQTCRLLVEVAGFLFFIWP